MGRLFSYEDKDREVFWNLHSRQSVSYYNTIWTDMVHVYVENMQDIPRKELLIPACLPHEAVPEGAVFSCGPDVVSGLGQRNIVAGKPLP